MYMLQARVRCLSHTVYHLQGGFLFKVYEKYCYMLLFPDCNDTRQSMAGLSRHCELNIMDKDMACALILKFLQIWCAEIRALSEGVPFSEFLEIELCSSFPFILSRCILFWVVTAKLCLRALDIHILGIYSSWSRWYFCENVTKAGTFSRDLGNLRI